jgi:hypothetical protein
VSACGWNFSSSERERGREGGRDGPLHVPSLRGAFEAAGHGFSQSVQVVVAGMVAQSRETGMGE